MLASLSQLGGNSSVCRFSSYPVRMHMSLHLNLLAIYRVITKEMTEIKLVLLSHGVT
jgi:hypothetical protein